MVPTHRCVGTTKLEMSIRDSVLYSTRLAMLVANHAHYVHVMGEYYRFRSAQHAQELAKSVTS